MGIDNAPKSSVELAMERLRKRDADAGIEQVLLTEEQKAAITEIRNFYGSKMAELEILQESRLRRTFDPAEHETIESEYPQGPRAAHHGTGREDREDPRSHDEVAGRRPGRITIRLALVHPRIALILVPAMLAGLAAPARAVTEPVPPAVMTRDADGSVTIRAVRLAEPLVLDGRLDDPIYRDTLPIDRIHPAGAARRRARDREDRGLGGVRR